MSAGDGRQWCAVNFRLAGRLCTIPDLDRYGEPLTWCSYRASFWSPRTSRLFCEDRVDMRWTGLPWRPTTRCVPADAVCEVVS